MKNSFFRYFIGAAAIAIVPGCTIEQVSSEDQASAGQLEICIEAGAPTKTALVFGEDIQANWSKGDVLGFFFDEVSGTATTLNNSLADGAAAKFYGKVAADVTNGFHTAYGVVPGGQIIAVGSDSKSVTMRFKRYQYPANNMNYDPAADILVAVPEDLEVSTSGSGNQICTFSNMRFARAGSIVKVAFTNHSGCGIADDELIEKISFTAAGVTLAGYANVDLTTGEVDTDSWRSDKGITDSWDEAYSSTVGAYFKNLTYGSAKSALQAYLCLPPCTIPSGTSLTFILDTDKHHIEKTVSVSSVIDLTADHYQEFNINLSGVPVKSWVADVLDYDALGLTGGEAGVRKSRDGQGPATGKAYKSVATYKDVFSSVNNLIDFDPKEGASKAGVVSRSTSGTPGKVVIDWAGAKYSKIVKLVSVYAIDGSYSSVDALYNTLTDGDLIGSLEYVKAEMTSMTGAEDVAIPAGYTNIGIKFPESSYPKSVKVYWIDNRSAQTISFSPADASYELAVGDSFESPVASSTNASAVITYSSSNEAVATVDASTGEVTLVGGTGTAVITAETAGDDAYTPASASYTIVVGYPSPVLTSISTGHVTAVPGSDGHYVLTFHGSYAGEYLAENNASLIYWFQGDVRYGQKTVTATANSVELNVEVPSYQDAGKNTCYYTFGDEIKYYTTVKVNATGITTKDNANEKKLKVGYLAEWVPGSKGYTFASEETYAAANHYNYGSAPSVKYQDGPATSSPVWKTVANNYVGTKLEFFFKSFANGNAASDYLSDLDNMDYILFNVPVESYTANTKYYFNMTLCGNPATTAYSISSRIGDGPWVNAKPLSFPYQSASKVSYPVSFNESVGSDTDIQLIIYYTSGTANQCWIGESLSLTQEIPSGYTEMTD